MTKYVTLDEVGNINGMFLDDPGNSIELSDEDWQSVGPGFKYLGGKLIAPTERTAEEISEEEDANKKAGNNLKKLSLMQKATETVSILQDSVDFDMATEEESALLPQWKKYRVLLSRINADVTEEIEWPQAPE